MWGELYQNGDFSYEILLPCLYVLDQEEAHLPEYQ